MADLQTNILINIEYIEKNREALTQAGVQVDKLLKKLREAKSVLDRNPSDIQGQEKAAKAVDSTTKAIEQNTKAVEKNAGARRENSKAVSKEISEIDRLNKSLAQQGKAVNDAIREAERLRKSLFQAEKSGNVDLAQVLKRQYDKAVLVAKQGLEKLAALRPPENLAIEGQTEFAEKTLKAFSDRNRKLVELESRHQADIATLRRNKEQKEKLEREKAFKDALIDLDLFFANEERKRRTQEKREESDFIESLKRRERQRKEMERIGPAFQKEDRKQFDRELDEIAGKLAKELQLEKEAKEKIEKQRAKDLQAEQRAIKAALEKERDQYENFYRSVGDLTRKSVTDRLRHETDAILKDPSGKANEKLSALERLAKQATQNQIKEIKLQVQAYLDALERELQAKRDQIREITNLERQRIQKTAEIETRAVSDNQSYSYTEREAKKLKIKEESVQRITNLEKKQAEVENELGNQALKLQEKIAKEQSDLLAKVKGRSLFGLDRAALGNLLKDFNTAENAIKGLSKSLNLLTVTGGGAFAGFGFGTGGGAPALGPLDFNKLADGVENFRSKLELLPPQLSAALGPLTAVAQAALKYVGFLKQATDTAVEYARNQRQLADSLNITAETVSALTLGFQRTGQPLFTLDIALSSLPEKMRAAAEGDEKIAKAFDRLGVSVTDVYGRLKSTDQVLAEIADAHVRVGNSAEVAASRVQIFGIFGQRAVGSTLSQYRELQKEVRETGLLLDEQSEQTLLKYFASLTKIETLLSGTINKLGVQFAPALTEVNEKIFEFVKGLDLGNKDFIEGLVAIGAGLLDSMTNIVDVLNVLLKAVNGVVSAFGELGPVFGESEKSITSTAAAIGKLTKGIVYLVDAIDFLISPVVTLTKELDRQAERLGLYGKLVGGAGKAVESFGDHTSGASGGVKNLTTQLAEATRAFEKLRSEVDANIAKIQALSQARIDAIEARRDEGDITGLDAVKAINAERLHALDSQKAEQQRLLDELRLGIKKINSEQSRSIDDEKRKEEQLASIEKKRLEFSERIKKLQDRKFKNGDLPEGDQKELDELIGKEQAYAKAAVKFSDDLAAKRKINAGSETTAFAAEKEKQLAKEREVSSKIEDLNRQRSKAETQARREAAQEAERERERFLNKELDAIRTANKQRMQVIDEEEESQRITKQEATKRRIEIVKSEIETEIRLRQNLIKGAGIEASGGFKTQELREERAIQAKIEANKENRLQERLAAQEKITAIDKELAEREKAEARIRQLIEERAKLEALSAIPGLPASARQAYRDRIDALNKEIESLDGYRDKYKEITDEIVKLEEQLTKEKDQQKKERIQQDIEERKAILEGRAQTNAQIKQQEVEISKLRVKLAEEERAQRQKELEGKRADFEKQKNINNSEIGLLEAKQQAAIEFEKKRSGLSKAEIDAGLLAGRLAQVQVQQQKELLQAKIDNINFQIRNLRDLGATEDQINALVAERIRLEAELAGVVREGSGIIEEGYQRQKKAAEDFGGEVDGIKGKEAEAAAARKAQLDAAAGIYSQLAAIVGQAAEYAKNITIETVGEAVAEIDKLRGRLNYFYHPQIIGLQDFANKQNEDAIKIIEEGIRRAQQEAARKAAEEQLAAAKDLAKRIAEIQKQANQDYIEAQKDRDKSLADLEKQREEEAVDHEKRLADIRKDNQKRLDDFDQESKDQEIERERDANREKLEEEQNFQRQKYEIRRDANTRLFSQIIDGIKAEARFRQAEAELRDSEAELEKNLAEARKALGEAQAKGDQNAIKDANSRITEILKQQADIKRQREILAEERETQKKRQKLEADRQAEIAAAIKDAEQGKISQDELNAVIEGINEKYDLEQQYLSDRLELYKSGDKELLKQLDAAYAAQRIALQQFQQQELQLIRAQRALKQQFAQEDATNEATARAKRRQDLINENNQRLIDEEAAHQDRLKQFDENEQEIEDRYKETLDNIKSATSDKLAELKGEFGKLFDYVLGNLDKLLTKANETIKGLAGIGGEVKAGDGKDGKDGKDDGPKPNQTGGGQPGGGGKDGPSSATIKDDPTKPKKPGNTGSTVGSGGQGTPGQPGTPSQGTSKPLPPDPLYGYSIGLTADNGNALGQVGKSGEDLANKIIAAATSRGGRGTLATPDSVLDAADTLEFGYKDPRTGEVIRRPVLTHAEAQRIRDAVKSFYTPENILRLSGTDSYRLTVLEFGYKAGLISKPDFDRVGTNLRKRIFFTTGYGPSFRSYGRDVIEELDSGKISPSQAWTKFTELGKTYGPYFLIAARDYLKTFYGFTPQDGTSQQQSPDQSKTTASDQSKTVAPVSPPPVDPLTVSPGDADKRAGSGFVDIPALVPLGEDIVRPGKPKPKKNRFDIGNASGGPTGGPKPPTGSLAGPKLTPIGSEIVRPGTKPKRPEADILREIFEDFLSGKYDATFTASRLISAATTSNPNYKLSFEKANAAYKALEDYHFKGIKGALNPYVGPEFQYYPQPGDGIGEANKGTRAGGDSPDKTLTASDVDLNRLVLGGKTVEPPPGDVRVRSVDSFGGGGVSGAAKGAGHGAYNPIRKGGLYGLSLRPGSDRFTLAASSGLPYAPSPTPDVPRDFGQTQGDFNQHNTIYGIPDPNALARVIQNAAQAEVSRQMNTFFTKIDNRVRGNGGF